MTKTELQEDNAMLRQKMEEIYDILGDVLGFDDEEGESDDIDDGS